MGLDMYAYVAAKPGQMKEYWDGEVEFDKQSGEFVNKTVTRPHEIAYWRKHPNLHGWMYNLWVSKGNAGEFNGDELELTWEDIDQLEYDVELGKLKDLNAKGFFWGDPSDDYYYEEDVKFIAEARAQLFLGLRVFYNSSW